MAEALLGPKLETALIAWLSANKGSLLSGVTLQGAHASAEPVPPYISVWCSRAPVHPDFAGLPGSQWPRRASVEFFVKGRTKGGAFASTVGLWAAELQQLLARFYTVAFTAATSDTITAAGHVLPAGALVRVSNVGGGLPGGLSAGVDYYVRDVSGSTLKLSTSPGGAAVDITSAGTGTHTLTWQEEFSKLRAGINAGGSQHPSEGLRVDAVQLMDEGSGVDGDCWVCSLMYEIDAEGVDR